VVMAIQGHSGGNARGTGPDMNFWYDIIEDSDLIDAIDKIEVFLQNDSRNVSSEDNTKS